MTHDWTRFWSTPESEISLGDQGFLVAPGNARGYVPSGNLESFEQIAAYRCLILLGEPGMGKSQALQSEAGAIEARADQEDAVLWADLGATRDEDHLRRKIFGSPEFEAWAAGAGELHLFLDSLDEAVLRLGVVSDMILDGLENVDTQRLRLRLACRTADRLPDFEARLRARWPEDQSGVYELAPLCKADVRTAATDRAHDPDQFVQTLIERDIVPLAIKPITLAMLLDLADDADGLPSSQVGLYERGLRKLVAEPLERRDRDPQIRGDVNAGQRLAVAARIAAAMILSGRTAIATSDAATSSDVVTLAQLEGGSERDIGAAVPTTVEVSDVVLREVLGTGLFSAHGDHLGWAHQTYAEYLGAYYLVAGDIGTEQAISLLGGDDGRIAPQLRDIAGWASAMSPALMDVLAERDPLVLLRGDVAVASDEQKLRLAQALLRPGTAHEVSQWDPRVRRNLGNLACDGLADVIGPVLNDRAAQVPVRELACGLALLCGLGDLQEDLVRLALDADEPVYLRSRVVAMLQDLDDDETLRRLLPLAREPLPEDGDDELKGTALRALCPRVVSAAETLAYLTPEKNTHYTGSYAMYLAQDLPKALTNADLPEALNWTRRVSPDSGPLNDFRNLADQILILGAEAIDQDGVEEALVELVAHRLENHRELYSGRMPRQLRDRASAFVNEAFRRRMVEALVPFVRSERIDPLAIAISNPRLVADDDLPWLIENLDASIGANDETIWAELIAWVEGADGVDRELIWDARERSHALAEATLTRFGPIELDSDLATALRTRHRRQGQRLANARQLASEAPDYDRELDALLDRFEAGDLDAFSRLAIYIWGEEGDPHFSIDGTDLTKSAGWQRATPTRRARIAAAATAYLHEYSPSDEWLDDPSTVYRPATAGYQALRYMADHESESFDELDQGILAAWIPAILGFTPNSGDEGEEAFSKRLLERVRDRCPERLTEGTRRLVLAEANHNDGNLVSLYRLDRVLDGPVGSALLALWRMEDLRPTSETDLLKALLEADVQDADTAGVDVLTADLVASEPDRARRLASVLLAHGRPSVWDHIQPLVEGEPEWGKAVLEELAHDRLRKHDFRMVLSEDRLADLHIWLVERFSPDDDPPSHVTGFVTARDSVGDYRDDILSMLVRRGTDAAVEAIDRIVGETGRDLTYVQIRADENRRLEQWLPPRPEDVVRLAADPRRRLVLSADDLQRVVVEALGPIQEKLGAGGQANQVWDTTARRPKQETEIAAWIAARLQDDLVGRGIVVNREIEVRVNPRGGIGQRTDIQVDAIAGERVEGAERLTLTIEVKGCWHPELSTAVADQLAGRYLSATNRHGIYLVAWSNAVGWGESDRRRRARACRRAPDELRSNLDTQARELADEGYEIVPVVLDISLQPDEPDHESGN